MLMLSSTVVENTSGLYIFSLVDAAGQGLAASQIEALTLTYYDVASGLILNGRDEQDVLNANHVTLTTVEGPPLVTTITWTLQPADTIIVDTNWPIEQHAAIFRWTWDSGTRHGAHPVQFGVENVADAGGMLMPLPPAPLATGVLQWRGPWQAGTYAQGDLVRDASWLLACIAPGGTSAPPVALNTPLPPSSWVLPDTPAWSTVTSTASQVWIGLRLHLAAPTYLTSLRYWQEVTDPASLRRDLYLRLHPGHPNEQSLLLFENITGVPTVTGWQEATLSRRILLLAGQTCDVILKMSNTSNVQDVTRTYRYTTPPNPQVPVNGEVVQGTKTGMDRLRVAYVDAAAGNNTAMLQALVPGCTISVFPSGGPETLWTVQAVSAQASYAEYLVTPVEQATASTGGAGHPWHFRTVLDNTVTYVRMLTYWPVSGPVQGMRWISSEEPAPVVDQTARGIDVALVEVGIHADWDLVSTPNVLV